ncbi:MAG: tetratricopeptide repeat protein [Planctomycetota bacterium]|nr:tetratricopeptide repeat protein [Planctomycetota bacterium]
MLSRPLGAPSGKWPGGAEAPVAILPELRGRPASIRGNPAHGRDASLLPACRPLPADFSPGYFPPAAFAIAAAAISATLACGRYLCGEAEDWDEESGSARPAAVIARARTLMEEFAHEEAERLLAKTLKENPKNVPLRRELSRLLFNLSRYEESESLLDEGLRLLPEHPDLLMEKGLFLRAVAVDGPSVRRRLGERVRVRMPEGINPSKWKEERLQKAAEMLRRAASLSEDPAVPLKELADVQRHLGLHDEAVKTLREAASRVPEDPGVWMMMAEAQFDAGRIREAEDCCAKALKLRPRSAHLHAGMWKILERAGKKEAAEAERKKALFYDFLEFLGEACSTDHDPAYDSWVLAFNSGDDMDDLGERTTELAAAKEKALADMEARGGPAAAEFLTAILYHRRETAELADKAAGILRKIGDPARKPLLAAARAAYRNYRGMKRIAVVGYLSNLLVEMKEGGVISILGPMLVHDPHAILSLDPAAMMARLGDPGAVPYLKEALRRTGPEAKPGTDDQSALLESELRLRVRRKAARALAAFKCNEAREALEAAAKFPETAADALMALHVQTGGEGYLKALCDRVSDPKYGPAAIRALAEIKAPKGADALLAVCAGGGENRLRAAAIEALGDMYHSLDPDRQAAVLKTAAELMQSGNQDLAEAAKHAMLMAQTPAEARGK